MCVFVCPCACVCVCVRTSAFVNVVGVCVCFFYISLSFSFSFIPCSQSLFPVPRHPRVSSQHWKSRKRLNAFRLSDRHVVWSQGISLLLHLQAISTPMKRATLFHSHRNHLKRSLVLSCHQQPHVALDPMLHAVAREPPQSVSHQCVCVWVLVCV